MSSDRAMEKFSKLPLQGEQTRGAKVFLKVDVSLLISVDLHTVIQRGVRLGCWWKWAQSDKNICLEFTAVWQGGTAQKMPQSWLKMLWLSQDPGNSIGPPACSFSMLCKRLVEFFRSERTTFFCHQCPFPYPLISTLRDYFLTPRSDRSSRHR